MDFSITFLDMSSIKGRFNKITHNGTDLTNASKETLTQCFIQREGKMTLITDSFNVEFYLDTVKGFTI